MIQQYTWIVCISLHFPTFMQTEHNFLFERMKEKHSLIQTIQVQRTIQWQEQRKTIQSYIHANRTACRNVEH